MTEQRWLRRRAGGAAGAVAAAHWSVTGPRAGGRRVLWQAGQLAQQGPGGSGDCRLFRGRWPASERSVVGRRPAGARLASGWAVVSAQAPAVACCGGDVALAPMPFLARGVAARAFYPRAPRPGRRTYRKLTYRKLVFGARAPPQRRPDVPCSVQVRLHAPRSAGRRAGAARIHTTQRSAPSRHAGRPAAHNAPGAMLGGAAATRTAGGTGRLTCDGSAGALFSVCARADLGGETWRCAWGGRSGLACSAHMSARQLVMWNIGCPFNTTSIQTCSRH